MTCRKTEVEREYGDGEAFAVVRLLIPWCAFLHAWIRNKRSLGAKKEDL